MTSSIGMLLVRQPVMDVRAADGWRGHHQSSPELSPLSAACRYRRPHIESPAVVRLEAMHEAVGGCKAGRSASHLREYDDGHLREVRQTCLAGIGLPIDVCDE